MRPGAPGSRPSPSSPAQRSAAKSPLASTDSGPSFNVVASVLGGGVRGVRLRDVRDDAMRDLAVQGCFIAIGHRPNTEIFAGQLEMENGYIKVVSPIDDTPAARALGALRDVEAIPLLIQVLETSEPDTASAAAEALAGITLQRLGPDARRWLGWWKRNRGRGRAEWLFSGLTSADRETRVAASEELAFAAPPPVPYSADAPAPERERTARAWAGWWARSGRVL